MSLCAAQTLSRQHHYCCFMILVAHPSKHSLFNLSPYIPVPWGHQIMSFSDAGYPYLCCMILSIKPEQHLLSGKDFVCLQGHAGSAESMCHDCRIVTDRWSQFEKSANLMRPHINWPQSSQNCRAKNHLFDSMSPRERGQKCCDRDDMMDAFIWHAWASMAYPLMW